VENISSATTRHFPNFYSGECKEHRFFLLKFSEEDRQEIFKNYYSLNLKKKRLFVLGHTTEENAAEKSTYKINIG